MIYTQEDPAHQEPNYQLTHWSILSVLIGAPFLFGMFTGFALYTFAIAPSKLHLPSTHKILHQLAVHPTPTAGASASLTPTPKPPTKWGSATAQYLQQVFGDKASTALLIAKEHHLNCQYGKGTRYVGLFAIDTIAEGMTEAQATDCYQNIDRAKIIYDREGFTPWGK